MLNQEILIKSLCLKLGITQKELAERLGLSSQALNNRLKRGTLRFEDLEKIAEVTDCKLSINYITPGGQKIWKMHTRN